MVATKDAATAARAATIVLKGTCKPLVGIRDSLRHSWLENLVDARAPEDVAELHTCEPAVRCAFDADIATAGGFDRRLIEVRTLASQMIAEFSPAALVETTLLAYLPVAAGDAIRRALHDLYLEVSGVDRAAAELLWAGELFETELGRFREVWERSPMADSVEVMAGFRQLKERGKSLHEALGRVPEGVLLP